MKYPPSSIALFFVLLYPIIQFSNNRLSSSFIFPLRQTGSVLKMSKAPAAAKEAVVFILDAFPTMNAPYPPSTSSCYLQDDPNKKCPSRLECAKQAIENMLFDMMLNSRVGSKALVIVTKTKRTRNHSIRIDQDPDTIPQSELGYPNLCELGWVKQSTMLQDTMKFPDGKLLRDLRKVKTVSSLEVAQEEIRGDIIDALFLAADALYKCSYLNHSAKSKQPYRYRRKIVLITDASHDIYLDPIQTKAIIDDMRTLECPLHVLGMGFGLASLEFERPLEKSTVPSTETYDDSDDIDERRPATKRIKQDPDGQEQVTASTSDVRPDGVVSSAEERLAAQEIVLYETLEQREKLLGSIAEKTGGSVVSIASMQELLDAKVGKMVRKSTLSKCQLHIGPGLTIEIRRTRLIVPEATPKIIEHAAMVDQRGAYQFNGLGQEMTEPIKKITTFWQTKKNDIDSTNNVHESEALTMEEDGEDADMKEVSEYLTADAIRYGKDLIPWGGQERLGLKAEDNCGYDDETFNAGQAYIHILGYVARDSIPARYIVGSPYGITGAASKRACTLVAALARSLAKMEFVALCTAKMTKTGTLVLAGLFPFQEEDCGVINRLLMFKLPFSDDVKSFNLEGFHETLEGPEEAGRASVAKTQSQSHFSETSLQSKTQASDNLVDALMLPDDAIRNDKIPSPFLASFNKTMLKRSTRKRGEKSHDDLCAVREQFDRLALPSNIAKSSAPALRNFRQVFPLKLKKVKAATPKGRGGGRENPTFMDHLP